MTKSKPAPILCHVYGTGCVDRMFPSQVRFIVSRCGSVDGFIETKKLSSLAAEPDDWFPEARLPRVLKQIATVGAFAYWPQLIVVRVTAVYTTHKRSTLLKA